MEWFEGDVSAGIAEAKKRNTLYVVYIRDDSDDSGKMDQTWDSAEVTEACKKLGLVAMRFSKDSSECKMFSQCYPVLIVPSVSFISGESGVLLEATAGHVEPSVFIERMTAAAKVPKGQESASTNQTPSTQPAVTAQSSPETQSPVVPTSPAPPAEAKESVQERAARLRKKMEEVHAKKEAQKREMAKQKELERRKVGQSVQKFQQQRAEQEAKEIASERRKEKMEDRIAKQKVREQIARDRAEKEARYAAMKAEDEKVKAARREAASEQQQAENMAKAAANRESARIQFRLPDGSKIFHQFPSSATLGEARQYLSEQIGDTLEDFSMSTAFPRRQFGTTDMDRSLLDLQLAPSAAVIVLPGSGKSSSSNAVSSGGGLIAMIFAPIVFLWNLLYTFIFGTRIENPASEERTSASPQEPSQAQNYNTMGARPKSSYVRRRSPTSPSDGGESISRQEGNIHRLNNRNDNDDDENNTWNGNSTQQM